MRFVRSTLPAILPAILLAACGGMKKPAAPNALATEAPPPRDVEVEPIEETAPEASAVAVAPAPPPVPAPAVVAALPAPTPAIATPVAEPVTGDPAGDRHTDFGVNPWTETSLDRLSTFAADVDTAAYTYARRTILEGSLPAPAAVRVEEFVNYFGYRFPAAAPDAPFAVIMDAAPSPLDPRHHVVRVGVATPMKSNAERKPANLVFLVDVSGSMASPDKLGLAQQSLRLLTRNLTRDDTVSLVTYAGSTGVVLPATRGDDHRRILAAIDRLTSGGSTAMASGLDLAYEQAMAHHGAGINSRVIVLSDGDANVGSTSHDQMLAMIADRVARGVTLSTIGFGLGNYRADLMEQLGDKGNGNNYYVDSAAAAEKLFTTDLVSVLEVAAKDVKLQVEFDPALVARYRLLGYENRDVRDQDFRVDAVDAGEIGHGHQVTALYEVQLTAKARPTTPLGQVRIRYKDPEGTVARELAVAMANGPAATFDSAPADLRFAVAVAGFADVLRGAEDARRWSLERIGAVARANAGGDPARRELVDLIERAAALRGPTVTVAR